MTDFSPNYPPERRLDAFNTRLLPGDQVLFGEREAPRIEARFLGYLPDPLRAVVRTRVEQVVKCVLIEPVRPTEPAAITLSPEEADVLASACRLGQAVRRSTTDKDWNLAHNRWQRCDEAVAQLSRLGLVVLFPLLERDRATGEQRTWYPTVLGRHVADVWPIRQ